jgi:hypothetical protein
MVKVSIEIAAVLALASAASAPIMEGKAGAPRAEP